jgi:hypothetical protein
MTTIKHQQFEVEDLQKCHWPTVVNAALARTVLSLFPSLTPENLAAINALEQRFAAQFQAEIRPEVIVQGG